MGVCGKFLWSSHRTSENCNLGGEETSLIRDAFLLNMIDHETQKELLKGTVEPSKALQIAIQMEMGPQNQQKINQNVMSGTNSVNSINSNQIRNRNANVQQTKRDFTLYATVPQIYQYTSTFKNFGLRWSHNHKQICLRTVRNAIIVALLAILQENAENRKNHRDKH